MEKQIYIYKKNVTTGKTETYTYVSTEEQAESLIKRLNCVAPFPIMYFYNTR